MPAYAVKRCALDALEVIESHSHENDAWFGTQHALRDFMYACWKSDSALVCCSRETCTTELYYEESNRFGICSFVRRRDFRSTGRYSVGRRGKKRRCDEESPVRARCDAATLYRQAQEQVYQAMSGQQGAVDR